ncbi:MAG: calcium/sodium antiporter [Pseudomonadota bacterium]|nr:calcium/sodium antiporter [Pseudomonadota bacterium]
MMLSILAVISGFLLLVWSAERCVMGALATARNFGVSPMVIGLTIVGFGTSSPELLVSGMASWSGNTGLAIGNAVGSNIANIGLVLGTTALLAPLTVSSDTLRRELPLLLAVTLLAYWLVADGVLGRFDGALLFISLITLIYLVVRIGLNSRSGSDPLPAEVEAELPAAMTTGRALFWLFLGLIVMLASSRLLVWGSVNIAQIFGVSDLVIGLTIIAIGTSLPELMASVMSVMKKESDLALGNIIGSNMFNLLGVLSLPGLIHPGGFEAAVLIRDFPVMVGLTLVMFMMAYGFRGQRCIGRLEGGALLLAFGGYMVWLYITAIA